MADEQKTKEQLLAELRDLRKDIDRHDALGSEYVVALELLKKEKDLAWSYLEITGFMLVVLDNNGKVRDINTSGSRLLGYEKNDIIGKNWFDNFLPGRIRKELKDIFNNLIEGRVEVSRYYESPILDKNGKEIIINWFNGVLRDANGKIKTVVSSGSDVTAYRQTAQELELNLRIQDLFNKILRLSLSEASLEKILVKALDLITSLPKDFFINLDPKGAIFLIEDDPKVLVMKAHKNLTAPLLAMCKNLDVGRCVCGKAAQTGRVQFVSHMGKEHENRFEGISDHGHYCVPIIYERKVLGVINLYVTAGQPHNFQEEEFFGSVSDALAGIIWRKKLEHMLEERIEGLNRFLRVAVGREHKMIELKKRIKDLENELGERK